MQQANSLIHASSPYLLQHAYNPVEWYEWNETSLKKAKDENKVKFSQRFNAHFYS